MILDTFSIIEVLKFIGSRDEQDRRSAEWLNEEVYSGLLHKKVEDKLKKMYPKTWEAYNVTDYNLEKKVVEKKTKSYVKPPIRQLEQDSETKDYNLILEEFNFNDAMKLMDRYKNQHYYCAIGVIRERNLETLKDKYNFWALAPYEFSVFRNQNGEIQAWAIPTGKDADGFEHWTLWSAESHLKLKTKDYLTYQIVPISTNPLMVNPYGVIPFIYVPLDMTGKYPLPSSLTRQTVEINTNLSIYLTSGNMQIGQLVIKYPSQQPISWVVQGLMSALKLPQEKPGQFAETDAKYISPSPNLEGHKDSILTFMQLVLDEHGINSNSVLKQGESFTSGFDRMLASADVQDIIEDNQDMYTRVENEVYKIIKAMNTKDGIFTFKSEKLKVKFSRPKILTSDSEKLDNLKKKKELGLWEDWELIQEADPNLTPEEAQEKAEKIKQINKEKQKELMDGNQEGSNLQGSEDKDTKLPRRAREEGPSL